MSLLRQELEKNFLSDYKSYPATLFFEGHLTDIPTWIGFILNQDLVLDAKWHAVGLDDDHEKLLITLSKEVIGYQKERLMDYLQRHNLMFSAALLP